MDRDKRPAASIDFGLMIIHIRNSSETDAGVIRV